MIEAKQKMDNLKYKLDAVNLNKQLVEETKRELLEQDWNIEEVETLKPRIENIGIQNTIEQVSSIEGTP